MKMAILTFTVGALLIQAAGVMWLSALLAQGIDGITGFGYGASILITLTGRLVFNKPKIDMPALKKAHAEQQLAKDNARKADLRAKVTDFRR